MLAVAGWNREAAHHRRRSSASNVFLNVSRTLDMRAAPVKNVCLKTWSVWYSVERG